MMLTSEDIAYLTRRAEQELDLAQRSENAAAVKAHYTMLGLLLDRLHGPAPEQADVRQTQH